MNSNPWFWLHRPAGMALALALFANAAAPQLARACACGCGVFEVGTPMLLSSRIGGMFSFEYDFMDQNENWSGSSSAPASDNEDQQIRTSFVTVSGQYLFTRAWGASIDVPYWNRLFRTTDESGELASFTHGSIGDVRVRGTYTGFSPDLSTGVSAGLKLPTGDYQYANFDRDTQIGSGSTDLLLGVYHVGPLTPSRIWTWYADAQYQQPFAYQGDYQPGAEGNATAGMSYTRFRPGGVAVVPMLGVIGSVRARDAGAESNPDDSGYQRVLLSPGVDSEWAGLRAMLTLNVPLYQHVNGNQLVAPALFKLVLGRSF